MRDPREGVTQEGTIRTGAARTAIAVVYEAILRAAGAAVEGRGSLYVYGSVATGAAEAPGSDVDLLSIGLPVQEAARISADLSARFRQRCREVSIAPASWDELEGQGDQAYGLRVFLRHYCVHLDGADPAAGLPDYPADARAARGFNGDIARHLTRWRSQLEEDPHVPRLATRIARKTLLAVAGLVSVRDDTWSTDRRGCAARWSQLEPGIPLDPLVEWLAVPPHDPAVVRGALQGPVEAVVQAFAAEIGLWPDEQLDPAPPG